MLNILKIVKQSLSRLLIKIFGNSISKYGQNSTVIGKTLDTKPVYCGNDSDILIKTELTVRKDKVNANFQDKIIPKRIYAMQVFLTDNGRF